MFLNKKMEKKKIQIEYKNKIIENEVFLNYEELKNKINKQFNIIGEYKIYDNNENEITNENDYENFIKNNNKPKIKIEDKIVDSNYKKNNIEISEMIVPKKKEEKKIEIIPIDDSEISIFQKLEISKNQNEIQISKEEFKKNENENQERIQSLEKENQQLKKQIKDLENEINELKKKLLNEKKIEILNSSLKNHLEYEIEQFKQNLIIETLDYNEKLLNKELITNFQLINNKYKCENCNKKPINGIRYKCNECLNYNLCEKCYNDLMNNKLINGHKHKNFIKKDRNEYSDDNNYSYSYSTKGNQIIKRKIEKGVKETVVNVCVQNNGRYTYEDNSELICDPQSEIKCDPVKIGALEPNKTKIYYVNFYNLDKYDKGRQYSTYLNVKVGNKIIGEQIIIRLNILMDDSEYLKRFRKEYNLEKVYSDSKLLKYLKNFDYDFSKAFNALIYNNCED